MGLGKTELNNKDKFFNRLKLYEKIILTIMISVFLYIMAALYNESFVQIVSVADYLTWHLLFEFASILVSFSIFAVTFFVYEESRDLSMLILGCAFLLMGFLDSFHTFSFAGMPNFFIENIEANRATTLWILARSLGSIGILISVLIPNHIKSNMPKMIFGVATAAFSIVLFVIVTYFPDLLPSMHDSDGSLSSLKIMAEYIIIFIMLVTFLIVLYSYKRTSRRFDHQFLISLVLLIFSEFSFTNYGSVYDAYNYIGHIYKVIAFFILYKAIFVANVSEPYRQMKKARNELKEYSENLNLLVEQRTNEIVELNKSLLQDIEYAREMQLRLIPGKLPDDEYLSFHAEYLPAERLSGDFYNAVKLDDDNLAVYIGDVSGHGVAAAMLTVFAYQQITPFTEEENETKIITPPSKVLDIMFKGFNKTEFIDSTYIVMFYGIYNKKTKILSYASAGLNVVPYILRKNGELVELNSKGFPICKLGGFVNPTYEERQVKLMSGDRLLLYSDGLIETKNVHNKIFGQDSMKEFLESNHDLDALALKNKLKDNLQQHMGKDGKLMDDVTFMIMEID